MYMTLYCSIRILQYYVLHVEPTSKGSRARATTQYARRRTSGCRWATEKFAEIRRIPVCIPVTAIIRESRISGSAGRQTRRQTVTCRQYYVYGPRPGQYYM